MTGFRIITDKQSARLPVEIFWRTGKRRRNVSSLTVEFFPRRSPKWLGRFESLFSTFDCVVQYPDEQHVMVVSGGVGYIIDPVSRGLLGYFGDNNLQGIIGVPGQQVLIFIGSQRLYAFDVGGLRWTTTELAWEGLENLSLEAETIHGWGEISAV